MDTDKFVRQQVRKGYNINLKAYLSKKIIVSVKQFDLLWHSPQVRSLIEAIIEKKSPMFTSVPEKPSQGYYLQLSTQAIKGL
ncbi:hypothetical protein [Anabaena lutea]|uniref:Uncharacterized protein n=1 Tax=Anabaena lutea FACHB-196 TaxID=2692881 RepID=A0ABR8FMV1_9NOST|nr:hypothetical protein [Anabaena lutea]MBD2570264.1 hypothetical protein [Anabaena lutea FACHB-196]